MKGLKEVEFVQRNIGANELRAWLGKDLVKKVQAQWGELECYSAVGSNLPGQVVVQGLQVSRVISHVV
jgi:hypothetical protein